MSMWSRQSPKSRFWAAAAGFALALAVLAGGAGLPLPTAQGAAAVGVAVEPAQVTVAPGGSASLTLAATAPAAGLGAWTIDINYNTAVVQAASCTTTVQGATALCNRNFAPGKIRVTGIHPTGVNGSFVMATLGFVAAGAGGSSSPIAPTLVTFADPSGAAIPASAAGGQISISGGSSAATATVPPSPTLTVTATSTATAAPTQEPTPAPTATAATPPSTGGGGGAPAPTATPTQTPAGAATATATALPSESPGPGQAAVDGASGGQLSNLTANVHLVFPPGAFSGAGTAVITPRNLQQSMPAASYRALQSGLSLQSITDAFRSLLQAVEQLPGKVAGWLWGSGNRPPVLQIQPQEASFAEPPGRLATRLAFDVAVTVGSESVTRFAQPVSLTVNYGAAELLQAGGAPANLRLMRYAGGAERWSDLNAQSDAAAQTLTAAIETPGMFAVIIDLPEPGVVAPLGSVSADLSPLLQWASPAGTVQYHLQVSPAVSPFTGQPDGPGINLIIAAPDLVAQSSYRVAAPDFGAGNYLILPGMTYTWRVRTTAAPFSLGEQDPQWSGWVSGSFRTAAPSSDGISPVSPAPGGAVTTLRPALTWQNSDRRIFYYEVQVSADPDLVTDPASATAAVYWNLVHGGETAPPNSWAMPEGFALEPGKEYSWRVRPRVQGDGEPVAWSGVWRFQTP